MKVIQCVQGSDQWWEAKRGIPSASNFDRIITAVTGKPSAGMKGYIAELIADTASMTPSYFTNRGVSRPMQNGHDMEPEARRYYALERNVDVQQVGFCISDCGRFGCSPDGLVGEDGGLELKCPSLHIHAGYLIDGTLPNEYKAQVHGALVVTGRAWWDFLSYGPGLDPLLIRVKPNEFTDKLRAALEVFWVQYRAAVLKVGSVVS